MENKKHADNQIIYVTNSAYDELQGERTETKQRNPGEKNKTIKFNDI